MKENSGSNFEATTDPQAFLQTHGAGWVLEFRGIFGFSKGNMTHVLHVTDYSQLVIQHSYISPAKHVNIPTK